MVHQTRAPPKQVKPVHIAVVSTILHHAHTLDDVGDNMLVIANMIWIGFFFLCQPAPFCLQDVTLH